MTYVATMTTEHFEFQAIADSEDLAKKRIAIGFTEHLVEYKNYMSPNQYDRSPTSLARVRKEWMNEVLGDDDDDAPSVGDFTRELDEWYGIRVSCFKKDTDVMRDGSKI